MKTPYPTPDSVSMNRSAWGMANGESGNVGKMLALPGSWPARSINRNTGLSKNLRKVLRLLTLLLAFGIIPGWTLASFGQEAPRVPGAPQIVEEPRDIEISEGSSFFITPRVSGDEPLSYRWAKGGVELADQQGQSLVISGVTLAQAGEYRLVVSNLKGTATSRPARVDVISRDELANGRGVAILDWQLGPGPVRTLSLRHAADTDGYFVLMQGDDPTRINRPTAMTLGRGDTGVMLVTNLSETTFFRVRRFRAAWPQDADGDQIDDVFELRHPRALDPLSRADALRDADGDTVNNVTEFQRRTDPERSDRIFLEVESPENSGNYQSLDRSVVPTLTPKVRIRLGDGAAAPGRVVVRSRDPSVPPMDVLAAFAALQAGARSADSEIALPAGPNTFEVTAGAGDVIEVASGEMLNYGEKTLHVVYQPPNPDVMFDPDWREDVVSDQLLLVADPNMPAEPLSRLFQARGLVPVGFMRSLPQETVRIYQVELGRTGVPGGAVAARKALEGVPELLAATPHSLLEPRSITAERLPASMVNSTRPNTGLVGGMMQGLDRYDFGRAGFDDDGTDFPVLVAVDQAGNPQVLNGPGDELDKHWQHSYMATFAAHALRFRLLRDAPPPRATLAVVDTGFGNDTGFFTNYVDAFHPFSFPGAPFPAGIDGRRILTEAALDAGDPGFGGAINSKLVVPLTGAAGIRGDGVEDFDPSVPFQVLDLDTRGHGTDVALEAVGNGRSRLGLAPWARLLPVRIGASSGTIFHGVFGLAAAIQAAAIVPEVDVINVSSGGELRPAPNDGVFCLDQLRWLPVLAQLDWSRKIVTIASGNNWGSALLSTPGVFAPRRNQRDSAPPVNPCGSPVTSPYYFHRLAVPVSATDLAGPGLGMESFGVFSDVGSVISVSAPGGEQNLFVTATNAFINEAGTSFAAPKVGGLLTALVEIRDVQGRRPAGQHPVLATQMELIETVEATADDLEASGLPALNSQLGELVTDVPVKQRGNPEHPDDRFGWGRINAWKAMLSVANGGLAEEGREDKAPADGRDDTFRSLKLVGEPQTQWYGFRIRTSVKHATAWIDGQALTDPGAPTPDLNGVIQVPYEVRVSPAIKAYAGVVPWTYVTNGVGRAMDPGLVPVGNDGGEFLITFSASRGELLDSAGGFKRVLELRRPNQTAADRPFFRLRLELPKMRAEQVPGVEFDDFVFEITPTDFGDAPLSYKTALADNGARALNTNLEWLGPPLRENVDSVSPEPDATDQSNRGPYPDATIDPDGVQNVDPKQGPNLDGADDGVTFLNLPWKEGQEATLLVTLRVADSGLVGRRYGPDDDRCLYLNGWIDWNADGAFGQKAERVLDGVRIYPDASVATGMNRWKLVKVPAGVSVKVKEESLHHATLEVTFVVPPLGNGNIWARFWVDYGENVGRNDPRPLFLPAPVQVTTDVASGRGATRYGEVEDYFLMEVDRLPFTLARVTLEGPLGVQRLQFSGPTTIAVAFADLRADGQGRDGVVAEMTQLDLTAPSSMGEVRIRVRPETKHPYQRSLGQIRETANARSGVLDVPPFAASGTAESHFDVYFEVEVAGMKLHSDVPKRMRSTISHKPPQEPYRNPDKIELMTEDERKSGFLIGGTTHIPDPERVPKESLLADLGDPDEYLREEAAKALGGLGKAAEDAVPLLEKLLLDPIPRVRSAAAEAIGLIRAALPVVLEGIENARYPVPPGSEFAWQGRFPGAKPLVSLDVIHPWGSMFGSRETEVLDGAIVVPANAEMGRHSIRFLVRDSGGRVAERTVFIEVGPAAPLNLQPVSTGRGRPGSQTVISGTLAGGAAPFDVSVQLPWGTVSQRTSHRSYSIPVVIPEDFRSGFVKTTHRVVDQQGATTSVEAFLQVTDF